MSEKLQISHPIEVDKKPNSITLDEKQQQEYDIEKTDIQGVTITEVHKLKKSINIDTLTSQGNLRKGLKGPAVQALQAFLIKNGYLKGEPDSDFGSKTEKALKTYQKFIGYKNPDGVFTVSKNKNDQYYKTLQSIIDNEGFSASQVANRSATLDEVLDASIQVNESIKGNIDKIKKSQDFYKALEAREDGGFRTDIISDKGSILGILREVFGANKASEYLKKMDSYKGQLENPKMQKLFNEGYEYLVKDTSTRNNSLMLYGFRDVLTAIFVGIPLFDVKINFIKSLKNSGIDMQEATIFASWIDTLKGNGEKQSFENYKKKVGPTITIGENLDKDLNRFKGVVTAYITSNFNLTEGEITPQVIKELRKTDKNLDNLIKTYINDGFVPDAKTLLAGGFNIFEQFLDDKYEGIKLRINGLNGGEVLLTNTARKEASSSEKTQNVFLVKNGNEKNGFNFYIHIGTEYKNLGIKRPSKEEIVASVEEYNQLGLTTHGGGMHIWKRLKLKPKENKQFLKKDERLVIAHDIMDLFKQQNTKSKDNRVGVGKLNGHIEQAENRLEYNSEINNKNSSFLKSAILILESKNISPKVKQNFSILKFYNSTQDFLNAYTLPQSIEKSIAELDIKKLTPEEYITKLIELSNNKEVNRAFDAVNGGSEGLKNYRLANLATRLHTPKYHIDAGDYKYGARILSKREFNMPYSELQAEYKKRFDAFKSSHKKIPKDFKQEFTGKFEDVYGFKQPSTYNEYLESLLATTGPNKKDETWHKYVSTMDLHERGLIEAGVYNITGEQLKEAIKDRGEAVPIEKLYSHPYFRNTARQEGYAHDSDTTFPALHEERGDEKIIHTTIVRSFSYTSKSGENITQNIIYDIYMRPECDNIYVLPNSKSIQLIQIKLKQYNAVSILNTPSLPVGLFGLLKLLNNGGNVGPALNGGTTTPGVGVGGGGTAGGGGLGVGF